MKVQGEDRLHYLRLELPIVVVIRDELAYTGLARKQAEAARQEAEYKKHIKGLYLLHVHRSILNEENPVAPVYPKPTGQREATPIH